MPGQETSDPTSPTFRIEVIAEADPSVLTRVIWFFQTLNLVPMRVLAERQQSDTLRVCIDIIGMEQSRISLIAARIGQLPPVLSAAWHLATPSRD